MNDASEEEIRKHVRLYIGVFLALLVFTALTAAVSYVHIGPKGQDYGNIAVALLIAVIKAGLVALFFMHLVSERKAIYGVLAFTFFFFLGLMLLTSLAYHDIPVLGHYKKAKTAITLHHEHVP